MIVVGMLSGTSVDGIDVAAAVFRLRGDTLHLTPLGDRTVAFDRGLHERVVAALSSSTTCMQEVCRLDTELGQAFAGAAETAVAELCDGEADLVVSHGQTVHHWVEGGRARGTLQLGDPSWIAERTGVPVLSGVRGRDIAAGGHGAPLVSVLDTLVLANGDHRAAALNLGGIANVTVVTPEAPPFAFDVGPANALIDAAALLVTGEPCDRDGAAARRGRVDTGLRAALLGDPYYRLPPPKSTGKEHFNAAYLRTALERAPVTDGDDLIATVTAAAAEVVAGACRDAGVEEVVAAGGGTRNPALMDELAARLAPVALATSERWGLPVDAKEAYAFALIGFLSWHGLPATVPSCTGARHSSRLGSLTPGTRPLRLPPPPSEPPSRIHIHPATAR